MTAYLGPLGSLVPVGRAAVLSPVMSRPVTYRQTLGGRVTTRQGPQGRRRWATSTSPAAAPDQLANLAAFVAGEFGAGPWAWADEWAQVTNLLTPRDAALEKVWVNTVAGGPQALTGGISAGRSLVVSDPAVSSFSVGAVGSRGVVAPVVAGVPVTVSAWLDTSGSTVKGRFHDSAGAVLSTVTGTSGTAGWSRVSVTTSGPPAGAAWVQVYVTGGGRVAKPAVTWTDRVMPYHAGQGCLAVVVEGFDQSVTAARGDTGGQMGRASVSVVEVGA